MRLGIVSSSVGFAAQVHPPVRNLSSGTGKGSLLFGFSKMANG